MKRNRNSGHERRIFVAIRSRMIADRRRARTDGSESALPESLAHVLEDRVQTERAQKSTRASLVRRFSSRLGHVRRRSEPKVHVVVMGTFDACCYHVEQTPTTLAEMDQPEPSRRRAEVFLKVDGVLRSDARSPLEESLSDDEELADAFGTMPAPVHFSSCTPDAGVAHPTPTPTLTPNSSAVSLDRPVAACGAQQTVLAASGDRVRTAHHPALRCFTGCSMRELAVHAPHALRAAAVMAAC